MTTYCIWHYRTTHFYEDDGGGSNHNEQMIDTGTDLVEMRERSNAHFQALSNNYRGNPPLFAEGAMKSSSWHSNGGGCAASGYLEIKELELPRL